MADHLTRSVAPPADKTTAVRAPTEHAGDLREADVVAYLKRHPRLLLNNPEILESLAPDTRFDKETVVVDMQRFVVDRLRRQVDRLKASSDTIISTTRANMSLVERTLGSALALLFSGTYAEIAQVLQDELPLHFNVDAVAIAFETDEIPADAGGVIRTLPPGTVKRLTAGQPWRIRPDTEGEAAIYGAAAGLVRSDALIALPEGEGLPAGLFAVGCRTPGHFDPKQGTELIAFLAHVTRYAVGRWWTLEL
ncbi:MAG: DUF484 family protein [Rhodospirillaceae bacterium]|nr:DUF484 family protein [Rhodospirillaceae bacterium]